MKCLAGESAGSFVIEGIAEQRMAARGELAADLVKASRVQRDAHEGGRRAVECATTALWSCRLAFFHPETHAPLVFEAAPPRIFPWDRFPWN